MYNGIPTTDGPARPTQVPNRIMTGVSEQNLHLILAKRPKVRTSPTAGCKRVLSQFMLVEHVFVRFCDGYAVWPLASVSVRKLRATFVKT